MKILTSYKLLIIFLITVLFSRSIFADDKEDIEYIQKLFNNKYFTEAANEIQLFIKKYTDSPYYFKALNLLGKSYYNLNQYNKAKSVFISLLNTEFSDEANYYIALILLKQKKISNIEKYVKNISEKNILKSKIIFAVANYFYENNNYQKSEKYFQSLFKYNNEFSIEALAKLGFIYYKQKKYLKTIAVLDEYINKTKSGKFLPLVYFILGISNEKLNQPDNAIYYYQTLIKKFPKSEYYTEALFNLSKIYFDKKDEKNLTIYVSKITNQKFKIKSQLLLAELKYKNNKFLESEKLYENILKNTNNTTILYKLILTQIKQKKWNTALTNLKKLKNTKYISEYYYYTGFILNSKKEYKKLVNILKDIYKEKIKPSFKKDCYTFVADAAYKIKNYDIAEKYYNELFLLTNDKLYLYLLSDILYKKQDLNKLEILFYTYKKKFPDDEKYKKDIYSTMAELYIEFNKYSKAEKVYQEYINYEKDEIIINNLMAVLLKQEKYSQMIDILKKFSSTPQNLYYTGVAYAGLKKYNEAISNFKKIIYTKNNEYIEKSYEKLINAFFSLKDYKNVIHYVDEYVNRNFKNLKPQILYKKGLAYFKLKKYTEALNTFEQLKNYPQIKEDAYLMLGEIYFNMNFINKAKSAYMYVYTNSTNSTYKENSLYWLITITYQNKNFNECITYINNYFNSFSTSEYVEDILFYLNDILNNVPSKTITPSLETLYKKTKNTEIGKKVLKIIIKFYIDQKDYKTSLKWIKKLPQSSYKNLWLGIIYEKLNQNKKSLTYYKKLINDKKYGDQANYYIGNYYFNIKNYSRALKYYKKVLSFDNSELKDEALLKIGLTYENLKNYMQAINNLLKIKILYNDSPFLDIVNLKLGELYQQIGKPEKSIQAYQELYTNFKNSKYFQVSVERLLIYYLNKNNNKEAKKYFNELKKINPKQSVQYEKFFK